MAMVQECYPENRALANGVYMATDVTIRSVVVLILGALGDWLGLRWAFVISAIVPLLGLPLILLLPEKRP
jgi:FSR family fosmidomycin resistance protein-like MFS transporter